MYQGCKSISRSLPFLCRIAPGEQPHRKKAPTWCSVDLRDGNQALVRR